MNSQEITIPVPWGHIAAKLWGAGKQRSIGVGGGERVLCLHGFQDNCGSFDRLIPLLSGDNVYLCFDWPNHGHSSATPFGVRWTIENYTLTVERVIGHVGWITSRFICIGHSMGGQVGKVYAAVYPDRVKKLVMLDCAGPVNVYPEEVGPCTRRAIDELLMLENGIWTGTRRPPEYTHREALDRVKRRVYAGSSTTDETLDDRPARTLMIRGYSRPTGSSGGYVPINNLRLKVSYSDWFSAAQHRNVVTNIRCPTLLIRAVESEGYYNDIYKVFIDLYKENLNFSTVFVQGNHDVHMNHPQRVAPFINKFINGCSSKL